MPQIAADPSRLDMFVDKGRVAARLGNNSFELRYTQTIVVQDFAGAPEQLFVPILAWIGEFQPELLAKPDSEPFRFDAEVLSADLVDVEIAIDLTEIVRVTAGDGGWTYVSLPEPKVDIFDGAPGATLWQLFFKDELIAQTTDPNFHPPAP